MQVGGPSQAVIRDGEGLGIFFGPDGLHIPLAPGSERTAKCKLVGGGLQQMGVVGSCAAAGGVSMTVAMCLCVCACVCPIPVHRGPAPWVPMCVRGVLGG